MREAEKRRQRKRKEHDRFQKSLGKKDDPQNRFRKNTRYNDDKDKPWRQNPYKDRKGKGQGKGDASQYLMTRE